MTEESTHISGLSAADDTPVFVISVAAQLAGMHAQTLRQYDRIGLVIPQRTGGGGRRYSARDIATLRRVQVLSQDESISLAGIQRIMELEAEVEQLREHLGALSETLSALREARTGVGGRFFAVGREGETVALRPGQRPSAPSSSQALVLWGLNHN